MPLSLSLINFKDFLLYTPHTHQIPRSESWSPLTTHIGQQESLLTAKKRKRSHHQHSLANISLQSKGLVCRSDDSMIPKANPRKPRKPRKVEQKSSSQEWRVAPSHNGPQGYGTWWCCVMYGITVINYLWIELISRHQHHHRLFYDSG